MFPLTPESVRDIGTYLDGLIILLDGYTGPDDDPDWETVEIKREGDAL